MSRAGFATAIIIGAGISLSAIAATRLVTHRALQAADAGDHGPDDFACDIEHYLTFGQPIGPRHIAPAIRPLEVNPCAGR